MGVSHYRVRVEQAMCSSILLSSLSGGGFVNGARLALSFHVTERCPPKPGLREMGLRVIANADTTLSFVTEIAHDMDPMECPCKMASIPYITLRFHYS